MKFSHILTILFIFSLFTSSFSGGIEVKLLLEKSSASGVNNFFAYNSIKRPKIALALSGGGARGISQVGVLQIFEENNIHIDFIAGVSIGSIIGGLYASGYSGKELENIFKSISWYDLFSNEAERRDLFISQKLERETYLLQVRFDKEGISIPTGLSAGQRLRDVLTDLILKADYPLESDFNKLGVPFRAIATDILNGSAVIVDKGELAEAMTASMSFPLLFLPVEKDGKLLVDGGMASNVPVDIARSMGADIVVAVDNTSPFRHSNELNAPWEIADQVINILMKDPAQKQLSKADFVIRPEISSYGMTNFSNFDSLILKGREEAIKIVPQIKEILDKSIHYDDNSTLNTSFSLSNPKIKVIGCQNIPSDTVLAHISPKYGSFSYSDIYKDLINIYNTGYFKDVSGFIDLPDNSITYKVYENIELKKISFYGNTVYSDSVLLKVFTSKIGYPVSFRDGKKDYLSILELYRDKGYSLANLSESYFDTLSGVLNASILEGAIDSILVEGNIRTRSSVVIRDFGITKGTIFNFNDVLNGINSVYASGLFSRVGINILRQEKGDIYKRGHFHKLILKIKVLEKKYNLINFAPRLDNERGLRGFAEFVDDNFLGYGAKVSLSSIIGERGDRSFRLGARADRLFRTFLSYNLAFRFSDLKYFDYSLNRTEPTRYTIQRIETSASIGQQVKRWGYLSFEGRFGEVTFDKNEKDSEKFGLQAFGFRSIADDLDKFPYPSSGGYRLFFYESAVGKLLKSTFGEPTGLKIGSKVSYTKFYFSLEQYFTFQVRNTLHFFVDLGFGDKTVPFSESFHVGGATTTRFGERIAFAGLAESEKIVKQLAILGFGYRYYLPSRQLFGTYFSLEFQVGGIGDDLIDVNSKLKINKELFSFGYSFKIAFDVSFFDIKFGSFEFGYGYNSLKDSNGKSLTRFYFSLGPYF